MSDVKTATAVSLIEVTARGADADTVRDLFLEYGESLGFNTCFGGFVQECPKCNGPMRVIALIEDPGVIRRILEHLGLWAPIATERSPPPDPANWPRHASLPLTYHPVPDIA